VLLSDFGRQVLECIEAIPRFNPGISLLEHVLMPDHLHMVLRIAPGFAEPLQVLGAAMRKFKSYTTTLARRQLGLSTIWQQGYHDRICTSVRFIDSTERYIAYNPLKWELGRNQPESLRVREPLDSPRLDPEQYWRGVGNIDLLDPKQKILSLRVSRRVKDFGRLLSRMRDAACAGYAILSGFISPGELAVRDLLLADPAAKLIRILPERMALGHRPESRYLPVIQERRYLEIAEGNEPTEFSRAVCLDLNAAIVSIATEGEGLAVYWKAEGPTVIGEGGASPSGLPPVAQS
jgi:REP element-mobilizing transposase RayT